VFFSELLRDIRFAIRVMLRTPAATVTAVLALALGIGVNVVSFISANSIILHPFPFPRLDRIVTVSEQLSKASEERSPLSPANYADLKRQADSFEQLAPYRPGNPNLSTQAGPERVRSYFVGSSFFSILGMKAELGRTFAPDEDRGSQQNVVVVSNGFWKSHLAASHDVIGKPLSLGGQNFTVVGVMPDSFDFPLGTELWIPLKLEPAALNERASHDLSVLALLKNGTSIARAQSEAQGVALRLASAFPSFNQDHRFLVRTLSSEADHVTDRFIETLVACAFFVLLLACANIGNLQLARAVNRQKEIAVRTALGASLRQVARQLLTETILLALMAAPVGLLLAGWYNDIGKADIPPIALRLVSGLRTMHIDGYVVGFTILLSILTGVLCTLPTLFQVARRGMRQDLTEVLRDRSAAGNVTTIRNYLRNGLIVFELALALTLLVSAALMVKTFDHVLHLNQGFDPKNILTLEVSLPASDYPAASKRTDFYDRSLASLNAIRGVKSAALSSPVATENGFLIEGQPEPRPGEPRPQIISASSEYLSTLHVGQVAGRFVSERDRPDSKRVIVLAESIARHYWPHGDAIGHRVKLGPQGPWLTIVGVCRDIIDDWLNERPSPVAYVPYTQFPVPSVTFVLRTSGDPLQAGPAARAAIRGVDRNLPVYELASLERAEADQRSGVRAAARLMTSYSTIALILAATGLYAVISCFVAARTHDIGIHMALGATRGNVLSMMMTQSARLILLGLALGIPLAYGCARLMSSALFGVVTLSFQAFVLYTGVLVLAALLAAYLPSRRATRIDPLSALREE
jgi:predicted permease